MVIECLAKHGEFLSIAEITKRFDISADPIRKKIRNGTLKFIRPGKKYLIPEVEIKRWLLESGNLEKEAANA